jgi:iron complex transport system permease protein
LKVDFKITILFLVLVSFLLASTFFIPTILSFNQIDLFIHLRLPKFGIAFLAGGALALAGYLSQLLLHNPLAEPYILGISGGASITVNLATFMGLPLFIGTIFMPYVYALVGTTLVAFLLFYKLKSLNGNYSSLLLIGLVINFFASACISLMMYLSKDSDMIRDMSFWFMGSYNKVSLSELSFVFIVTSLVLLFTQANHSKLHLLHLGMQRIQELGIDTNRSFKIGVAIIIILTTLIVSTCGPIGFVGLIVPHFVRNFNFSAKMLFPLCFLMGGALTLGAEVLSSAIIPQSLPPGVFTAMFGIPVFLYLLTKKYRFHL